MKNLKVRYNIINYIVDKISIRDSYADEIEIAMLSDDQTKVSRLIDQRKDSLKSLKKFYKQTRKEYRNERNI